MHQHIRHSPLHIHGIDLSFESTPCSVQSWLCVTVFISLERGGGGGGGSHILPELHPPHPPHPAGWVGVRVTQTFSAESTQPCADDIIIERVTEKGWRQKQCWRDDICIKQQFKKWKDGGREWNKTKTKKQTQNEIIMWYIYIYISQKDMVIERNEDGVREQS